MPNAKNEARIRFTAETEEFTSAIKTANGELKTLGSELKLADATFKNTGNAAEYLKSKASILKQELQANADKQKALTDKLEAAKRIYGEDSEQVESLKKQLIDAQTEEQKLTTELTKTNEELKAQAEQADSTSQAIEKIGKTGEQLQKTGKTVTETGEKFLPVTAAVVGIGTAAVKTTADFDKSMSNVKAISGATAEEFEALRSKAREMGADTKFSASEAADAMGYMAMAGWKTDDMLDGIKGVMDLAAASGEDLATTSDIVTDALTAFGKTAEDSGRLADILAAGSANANTNVSMLGESFKYVAPLSGAMGYSMEDTTTALGLMANAGVKASSGGTALRTMLTNLAKPSKSVAIAMDQLGISLQNEDGSMKSLKEVMISLREGFGDLKISQEDFEQGIGKLDEALANGEITQKEYEAQLEDWAHSTFTAEEALKAETAAALAGKTGLSGLLAIVNASEEDFEKLSGAIENSEGAAAEMAATMQDNLGGDLDILKSKAEELAISFGDMLMPVIRGAVEVVQGVVDKLNGMDESQRMLVISIAAVAAAIGPVLITVGQMITAVGTIMTTVKNLEGPIKALNAAIAANPMVVWITVILAVIAALKYLYDNCESFRNFVNGLAKAIVTTLTNAWNSIKKNVSAATKAVKAVVTTVFNGIRSFIQTVWNAIKSIITSAWNAIKSAVTSVVNGIKTVITTVFNAVKTFIKTVITGWKNIITTAWDAIKNAVTTAVNAVKNTISTVFTAVKDKVKSIWENIKSNVTGPIETAKDKVSTAVSSIQDKVSSTFESLESKVKSVWNGIKSKITDPINSAKQTVESAVKKIKGVFPIKLGKIFSGIKLPHFKISGGEVPWGIGGMGTKPSVSIEWRAKGVVFKRPAILNSTNGLQGVAEGGPEAVAPIEVLRGYVMDAVQAAAGAPIDYDLLANKVATACARMNISIDVDHRTLGRIVREMV